MNRWVELMIVIPKLVSRTLFLYQFYTEYTAPRNMFGRINMGLAGLSVREDSRQTTTHQTKRYFLNSHTYTHTHHIKQLAIVMSIKHVNMGTIFYPPLPHWQRHYSLRYLTIALRAQGIEILGILKQYLLTTSVLPTVFFPLHQYDYFIIAIKQASHSHTLREIERERERLILRTCQ